MEHDFEALVQQMRQDLHDLCQPLTALQCRLEMAKMYQDPLLLRDIVQDSLSETTRMFACIGHMRDRLLSAADRTGVEEAVAEL